MFERPTEEITYKKKKFTVQGFNVIESLNLRARYRKAQAVANDEELLNLMVDALVVAIVKPNVSKKKVQSMPEDDLFALFKAVTIANGFVPGKPKRKPKEN